MTEQDKNLQENSTSEEVENSSVTKDAEIPAVFKDFFESEAYKNSVRRPDGSFSFPSHIVAIKKAYEQLKKSLKK